MKLMTYLGLAVMFSLPAKAIYVDGDIQCYPSSVDAQAETILELWDVWDGWLGAYVGLQVSGPASASGIDSAWYPDYWATASAAVTNPAAGTYFYTAWHYAWNYYTNNWEWLYYYNTSCGVPAGGNDPTPVITGIDPPSWNAGTYYPLVKIYGSGFGTAPDLVIDGSGVSGSWTYRSDGYIEAQVSVSSSAPSGYANVQVIAGYIGRNFQQQPGGGGAQSNTQSVQVQGAQVPMQLSCPAQVTRGSSATCTLSGVNAGNVTGWRFLDGGVERVSGPSGVLTWEGTMVQSGTVRAIANGATLEVGITVSSRGWSTRPASPAKVANGSLSVILQVPPGPQNGYDALLGWSEAQIGWDVPALVTIGAGPNAGYMYYPSATHPAETFWYKYIIHPHLEDANSEFSQHQCGANGWISHSDLLTQTRRHEYESTTQSHHAFYSNAINSSANNLLMYVESRVGQPATDADSFNQNTGTGLQSRRNQIIQAMGQEPFPVNQSESGQSLGNVNLPPYASCN